MSVENPAVPLSSLADGDDTYDALTGGARTNSGTKVTHAKALGLSAVWRGVNLIAGDVARHYFGVYRYLPGSATAKEPDRFHPASRLMRKPNDYMTPFTFRQTLQAHALLYGNGYAYIQRSELDGAPLALLPLDPSKTWPVRVNGELWYVSQVTDSPLPGKRRGKNSFVKMRATDVLHIKGLGFDGLIGYPVLRVLRETIGGALAARDYGTRYFKNDASPGVVLEVPATMKDTAVANLRESWARMHEGWKNAHRPAILRDGVKATPFAKATARDAQMLESRAYDAREIANVLGVPPHKLGDPSNTAYNSLESENAGYREDTLSRWFCAWEQECESKLLTEEQKAAETHCFAFDPQPFAGVPIAQLASFASTLFNIGAINGDETRGMFGMNPLTNGQGARYMVPVNLAPAGGANPAPAPQPARAARKFDESKIERDPDGKFGDGAGGSDSGSGSDSGGKKGEQDSGDDDEAKAAKIEAKHKTWDQEDAKAEAARDKRRETVTSQIEAKREREKEKSQEKTQAAREKEDSKIEDKRQKQREKEDSKIEDKRNAEDDKIQDKRDKEDERARDKIQKELDRAKAKEEGPIEDSRQKAHDEALKAHKEAMAQTDKDHADGKLTDQEHIDRKTALEEKKDADAARIDEEHDQKLQDLDEKYQDEYDRREGEYDAQKQDERDKEDAEREAARQAEDDDREQARDEADRAEDEAREKAREEEDTKFEADFDSETEDQLTAAEAALDDEFDKEDAARFKARQQEDPAAHDEFYDSEQAKKYGADKPKGDK